MSSLSRRMMLKNFGVTGLLLVGSGAIAVACSGGVAVGDAWFRVGHLLPDAPPVDMYVNGDPFPGLQGVPFGALSDYFAVPVGAYQVEVTSAGDASAVVIDIGVASRRSRDYTVAMTGVLDAITPVVLTDTNCPVPYGKASVRVMHFSPDASEVDIVVEDGPTLFSGLAFGDVPQYEMVPVGTYDLQVVLSSNGVVMLDPLGMTFPGGRTTSVFVIGFAIGGSSDFSVPPVVDTVLLACKPRPSSGGGVCRVG